ncbi:MAG: hypothetical protein ACOVNQ_12560 [Pirellula sp.]
MSRYAFIAAATTFTGLLVVLTMAIAQRDARVTSTLPDIEKAPYSAILAKPIVVDSDAIASDGGALPSLPPVPEPASIGDWANELPPQDIPEIALVSGQAAVPVVGEPPKFDASRIVAPRPKVEAPPSLLPPGGAPVSAPPAVSLPSLPEVAPLAPPPSQPPVLSVPVNPLPSAIPSAVLPPSIPAASDNPKSDPVLAPAFPTVSPPTPAALPSPPPPAFPPAIPTASPPPSPSGRSIASDSNDPPSLTSQDATGWSKATSTPGSRQFEGSQNPSLEIHKRAPQEVQVGVAATFTAVVRNVGNATAFDVQVTDAIPKGSRFVRAFPEAQRVGNDGLAWNLGELAAGQEATISMEIVPETEGEIGSVASVKFAAQASVRTISTQPRLSIKQTAVAEMLGGDSATIIIDVTNSGTGVARDVRLEEDVPKVFRHVTGASALQQDVGDLAPGESMRFEIELMALSAGKVSNVVRATSANCATAESAYPIEVKAPKLQLQIVGPKLRHLERPAPYEAVIENIGTATAKDLYITARLPRGMNFISASNEGTYLPDQHSVAWNLLELAAGAKAKTEMVLLPVEEGRFSIAMTSDGEGVRAEPTEREVIVEGQSELTFEIDDDNDPIEVAGMTTYSIRINNIGTRPDAQVRLVVEAPEGASIEQVNSPMKYDVNGRQVIFAPIPSLASKQQVVVKVGVKHTREGTQVLRASLQSQLRAVPVIKDESTQVYRDQ